MLQALRVVQVRQCVAGGILPCIIIQLPGGWNGFTTLSDFYSKFENTDIRKGIPYPNSGFTKPRNRVNVGFLVGQQYNWATDELLNDRGGAPLIFTRGKDALEVGANLGSYRYSCF